MGQEDKGGSVRVREGSGGSMRVEMSGSVQEGPEA